MKSLIDQKIMKATVTEISWERIFVTIKIRLDGEKDRLSQDDFIFYGVDTRTGLAHICFKVVRREENEVSLCLNVTNNGENQCVPFGCYSILVCSNDEILTECQWDLSLIPDLLALSRDFLYGAQKNVFAVTFITDEDAEGLPFRMHVLNAKKAGEKFPSGPKASNYFKPVLFMKGYVLGHKPIIRRIYKLYSFLYKKNADKTVLFMTEQSKQIASNLKAVSDRMIARGLDKEYHILYSARTASAEPQGIKSWIHLMKLLAQADHIFIDDHAPVFDWLKLRETTEVTQLWHAGAGFKSSGYSRWGHYGCPKPQSCHRQYKYGIAGSKNIAPFFSEVWGMNDEQVLPTGMPRMDEYLDETHKQQKIEELRKKYPAAVGKKVILFAPTYRGRNKKTAYYPYELLDFDRLYELCGDEYVLFFKAHPWTNNKLNIEKKYKDRFFDLKNYPNINDLFYIVDLLITDYSSNIFEYSLMRKPMLFFAFDKTEYSLTRGFHRDYDLSAPGKVCETFEELAEAIEKKDFEYEKVEQYIIHHFDYIDSGASDRVIDWILLGKMPQQIRDEIDARKRQNELMNQLDFKELYHIDVEDDEEDDDKDKDKEES